MLKRIKIGASDFKDLIEGNNYFIDKSLLIKEFIENGAKIIYETDDDNLPMGELNPAPQNGKLHGLESISNSVNIYGYFGQPSVWPRGYPLEKIKDGYYAKTYNSK